MNKLNIRYYIKKYRLNSVFLRNLIMIILISMIPFGTSCFLVYKRAVNAMQNESEIIEQKQMDKMTASLDRFINSMDKMCIAILQRQSVRQIFSIKESTVNLSSNYMNSSDYSAPLTADDGIKLLFNSGITCMLEGEKYDSDGLISYTNNKDRYILSVNSNIFFGEGKMTCNGVVSLADDNNPDNSIKIDDTVYNVNDVDYTEFLGLKV